MKQPQRHLLECIPLFQGWVPLPLRREPFPGLDHASQSNLLADNCQKSWSVDQVKFWNFCRSFSGVGSGLPEHVLRRYTRSLCPQIYCLFHGNALPSLRSTHTSRSPRVPVSPRALPLAGAALFPPWLPGVGELDYFRRP